jgi:predicted amidohydrolase YtcJ
MYTIENARVLLMDREVGSLEPGKRADFVILDRDPLACPVDDIPDTRVLETWLDGRRLAVSP